MPRYFLTLSYDGSNYNGWQIQPDAPSVQQTLQEALSKLLRQSIEVVGAGRTDTGVHAARYIAHFDSITEITDSDDFVYHLNAVLPHDIAVEKISEVTADKHARFDAVSREYKYYISLTKNPFTRHSSWRVSYSLDIDKMNQAAAILGEYSDFASFAKLHSNNKTTICRIDYAHWEQAGDMMIFTIRADRFLRNMVRSVVGTLVDVGRGRLTIKEFRQVIEKGDRCAAGTSVPPQGLFLTDVRY